MIAIVGCGLIGGSLLKAIHQRGESVIAIDTSEATRAAIRSALGIEALPSIEGIRDATLVVLAIPVGALISELPRVAMAVRGDCVVTDVAGIKAPVLEAMARELGGRCAFVGGHPMAGKERGGFAEAEAMLFQERTVALCPGSGGLDEVAALWHSVGARTVVCATEAHDAAVARVSHLPYLVASALSLVAGKGDAFAMQLAAGGLRDTTRVAEDPTIRHAMVANGHVTALAREVAHELLEFADRIDGHDSMDEKLDGAAAARRRLFANRPRQ